MDWCKFKIGLDHIPDGDWYCPKCVGSSGIKIKSEVSERKRRRDSEDELENDDIVVLSDTDEDDILPPPKKHKCSLCGHSVADFDDLQVLRDIPPLLMWLVSSRG